MPYNVFLGMQWLFDSYLQIFTDPDAKILLADLSAKRKMGVTAQENSLRKTAIQALLLSIFYTLHGQLASVLVFVGFRKEGDVKLNEKYAIMPQQSSSTLSLTASIFSVESAFRQRASLRELAPNRVSSNFFPVLLKVNEPPRINSH